ncbi:VCBS domain-containing protein, partial [Sphingobium mellinum]|uniref:VCBS domain-containing protein n=1 Tax=Sphingobium mellinum TaxID=1387166 RepID=UPI0030EBC462
MGDISGAGGTTTSFSNTPQAKDDLFLSIDTRLTEDSSQIVYLDVMANDLGGNAKTLFSIDDSINSSGVISPADLLKQDTVRAEATSTDYSLNGAHIWITTDGKVGYDTSSLSASFRTQLQSLNAGQFLTDTFTYAIRLGNGTLSWATATVQFAGTNDNASISGTATGNVVEAGGVNNALPGAPNVGGTLAVADVDAGQATFAAVSSSNLNGTYGTFTFNSSTGQWTYALDNARAATQGLTQGQLVYDTLMVNSADGTASQQIKVTVTGSNDAAVIVGNSNGSVTEPIYAVSVTATGTVTDTDVDNPANTFQAVSSGATTDHGYGSFGVTVGGQWTYTLDHANASVLGLGGGQTLTDTFTVHSVDGTAQQVTIVIHGTDDTRVNLSASTVSENAADTSYVFTATLTN